MTFRWEVRDSIAVLTLDRPVVRHAMNAEMARGLIAAVDAVEADDRIALGVLTGSEGAFCSGIDLAVFAGGRTGDVGTPEGGFGGFVFRERRKPFIAAVEGVAAAGGFELALACEIIVASTTATFALPEPKVGLVAAGGGLARLPAAVGSVVAMDMLLTGDPITAERAYQLGLVSRLTEPGQAVGVALQIGCAIARNAPLAVRETLETVRTVCRFDDPAILSRQGAARKVTWSSADAIEGPAAFLAKRRPEWQGR